MLFSHYLTHNSSDISGFPLGGPDYSVGSQRPILLECVKRWLKANSTNFTHYFLCTGLGEYNCICEESSRKSSVALEEAAYNL